MAFRAKRKFTDWAVGLMMLYGPQLRFGPYNIISPTAQSVNLRMALNVMFYLLNYNPCDKPFLCMSIFFKPSHINLEL